MRILVEVPQDPTDCVLQGAVIGDRAVGNEPPSRWPWYVLQGQITTAEMGEFAVPRAMIGWLPYYAKPSEVGPTRIAGGEIVMEFIGPKAVDPLNVFCDPVQRWLAADLSLDTTGAILSTYVLLTANAEVPMSFVLMGMAIPLGVPIPRTEIANSGIAKRLTVAASLPSEYGTLGPEFAQETTVRWILTGVTRDSAGAALANCRVVVFETARLAVQAMPIVGETVSDGSGNYSVEVPRNTTYTVWSYKEGSPDVAGSTRQDVEAARV